MNEGMPRSSSAELRTEERENQPLRDEHKRLTRERLISTAVELFTQNGFGALGK